MFDLGPDFMQLGRKSVLVWWCFVEICSMWNPPSFAFFLSLIIYRSRGDVGGGAVDDGAGAGWQSTVHQTYWEGRSHTHSQRRMIQPRGTPQSNLVLQQKTDVPLFWASLVDLHQLCFTCFTCCTCCVLYKCSNTWDVSRLPVVDKKSWPCQLFTL